MLINSLSPSSRVLTAPAALTNPQHSPTMPAVCRLAWTANPHKSGLSSFNQHALTMSENEKRKEGSLDFSRRDFLRLSGIGSLAAGKLANIAVFDCDFLKDDFKDIEQAKCLATCVDGELVYQA